MDKDTTESKISAGISGSLTSAAIWILFYDQLRILIGTFMIYVAIIFLINMFDTRG